MGREDLMRLSQGSRGSVVEIAFNTPSTGTQRRSDALKIISINGVGDDEITWSKV